MVQCCDTDVCCDRCQIIRMLSELANPQTQLVFATVRNEHVVLVVNQPVH
jgi:hypothetical protein